MLARRFTIVCLMAAVFGMALSSLVAGTSRHDGGAWLGACGIACAPRALGL